MTVELRRKIIWSLGFAFLLYIGLAVYGDWQKLSAALLDFPWLWLPAVIGLTLVNYGGRLLRWHWYLRTLGAPISRADSARVFGVGMLMVMTPGKAGEFLKSYMIRTVTGTPMSQTAPAVLAERLTDGFAMLILASVGLLAFPQPAARLFAGVFFVGFLLFLAVIQIRPLALWGLGLGARMAWTRRFVGPLHTFYEGSYLVFRPRNFALALGVGLVCWAAEGVAYYVVLVGFGAAPGWQSLFAAVFIFSISTVIGALIAMPGGLGGVEGSLVALSRQIFGMAAAPATAAALLVRFCTLWLGVLIGVVSFILWSHLMTGAATADRDESVAADSVPNPAPDAPLSR
ncbi:MAG: lysylphosphatidylglycerol synthase transmembrane domain-containing protein [Litorilinea sp.]